VSYLIAVPEAMSAAATDVASIGSAVTAASQDVALSTTGVIAAAEDEVSEAIAALFSAHGQSYQALSAEVAAFHERFLQALNGAAGAYTAADAAAASPLAAFEGVQQQVVAGFESFLASPGAPVMEALIAWPPFRALFASEIPPLSWFLGNSPPPGLNALLGETVQYTNYQGMNVVQITPAHPTGEYVVALHGGGYILPVSFLHWINYSVTAYQTGATYQVPIYPLVQEGGTAATVVPKVASFISSQIALHGAQNVSVIGDSAGGNLAMSAVEYMVAQGDPTPSSMVLLSPWLDLALGQQIGSVWAGGLPLNNYLVSPLYGSLSGLPPTYVYSGGLDPLSIQAFYLHQAAIAQGAPLSFLVDPGEFHDWILGPMGIPYLPGINQQLGITG